MPTILRSGNLRIAIHSNDHRPVHVHVIGPDGEAVFKLHCPEGPPTLRESFGFSETELNTIIGLLITNLAELCKAWRAIHGNY